MKNIYTKTHQKIVKKLIDARKEVALTQAEVAQKIGKTQPYISQIESGQVKLEIVLLQQLAKIYKKPVTAFLE